MGWVLLLLMYSRDGYRAVPVPVPFHDQLACETAGRSASEVFDAKKWLCTPLATGTPDMLGDPTATPGPSKGAAKQ